MPLVTFSLPLAPGQGTLPAGAFIGRNGSKAALIADVYGVLAFLTDTTEAVGATVYTSGSFLRSAIEAANKPMVIDASAEDALRAKNIYLERSAPINANTTPTAVDELAPAAN
jgi:hypothetical protein